MKVAFYTLGCKVNQAETRKIKEQFETLGYLPVAFDYPADIVVINTCSVTQVAERKSRNLIRRTKKINPNVKIYVCGCYANLEKDNLKKELPEIYKIIPGEIKLDIKAWGIRPNPHPLNLPLQLRERNFRYRACLRIEDGCDQYCSYCIIPYARGEVVSYQPQEIVAEARQLVSSGITELILTGINIGKYQYDLVSLIEKLEIIPGLQRIRISSIEPNLITDKLIKKIKSSEKLAKHLHIPLQSGSDKILKLMNRPYQLKDFLQLVKKIRKEIKNIAITTDIIVGFPGETNETLTEAFANIKKLAFAGMHIFKYSPRPGTKAYPLKKTLTDQQIDKASKKLEKISKKLKKNFLKKFINQQVDVLVETQKSNFYDGLTSEYLRTNIYGENIINGNIIKVIPTTIKKSTLVATLSL